MGVKHARGMKEATTLRLPFSLEGFFGGRRFLEGMFRSRVILEFCNIVEFAMFKLRHVSSMINNKIRFFFIIICRKS